MGTTSTKPIKIQREVDTIEPQTTTKHAPIVETHEETIARLRKVIDKQNEKILRLERALIDKMRINTAGKFLREYEVKSVLGIGGGGCVFEAINKLENQTYAVKRIAVDPKKAVDALWEVQAMAQFDNPAVVRYNCAWIERPPEDIQYIIPDELLVKFDWEQKRKLIYKEDCIFIYIQMQLGNCTLSDWLEENQTNESRTLLRMKHFFKQITSGVGYIHGKNFIHRDLKPCNILLFDENKLKICDMGIIVERKIVDGVEEIVLHNQEGTGKYMSPEQKCCFPEIDSKSDVFTLGLILSELCVVMNEGQKNEIFDKYRKGEHNGIFGSNSETADFVRLLTDRDRNNRPSCPDMLKDFYLSNVILVA